MLKQVLENQYNKCLNILTETIQHYDQDLWYDEKNYQNPAWQIVYHALFYTNIYCSEKEESIIHWPNEKVNYQVLGGKTPWPPFEEIVINGSYTQEDMMEFLEFFRGKVPGYLNNMKPEAQCWPSWLMRPSQNSISITSAISSTILPKLLNGITMLLLLNTPGSNTANM